MSRIRVQGLVREANWIRQSLRGSLTPDQRVALCHRRDSALSAVDAILRRYGASPGQLPAPSRRAYEFLKQVDLSIADVSPAADAIPDGPASAQGSVSYRGLRSYLDVLLDDVALAAVADKVDRPGILQLVQRTAERLKASLEHKGYRPDHLTAESRRRVAWFRCFADGLRMDCYIDAVIRAQSVFETLPVPKKRWRSPMMLHFRPTSHLYRWHVRADGTRIVLPTPMITFSRAAFGHLGRLMAGQKRYWPNVTNAMSQKPYQQVVADMEEAGGCLETARGLVHDLGTSFERVRDQYFGRTFSRPRLAWTPRLSRRTFGHYEFSEDRVTISSSLDCDEVPAFVLDSVMYHELLHKKHGRQWRDGRQHVHTPAFRADERRFDRYAEANMFLERFAG